MAQGSFLSELRLSHFRSHRAARLQFDGRPMAIWGANGAGKTNILEAVSLLSPGRGLRRAATEDIGRRPECLGWKVAAVIAGREVETWAEGPSRQVRVDGKSQSQASLAQVARVVWLVPAMDRLWVEAAEGRRRFLDRLTLSFFPAHAEASLIYEKAMRDRNRLLRDQVTDAAWYSALEARMAEAGTVIAANRDLTVARLSAAQEGAKTAFPAADLTIEMPEEVGDLAQALAASRRRDMAAGRTLVGPHRADMVAVWAEKGVPAAQCSTGEQKALLISLILANARAIASGQDGDNACAPILLLDEVAAHLDAGRRAALYDEVCAIKIQALMTGTDAGLFAGLAGRAQGVEIADLNGTSEIMERAVT